MNFSTEEINKWYETEAGKINGNLVTCSDNYDQAISLNNSGDVSLNKDLEKKGIYLTTATAASTYYIGFNMLDSIVGGKSQRSKLLRQAITIAIDYDEYISIFANGRGILAQSPIPPGIFGYQDGKKEYNKTVFKKNKGQIEKRSIEDAKKLDILVSFTPDILSDDVADMALALYLGVSRKLKNGYDWIKSGNWESHGEMPLNKKISGSKCGILGLGRIGFEIAKRLEAFKTEIHYFSRKHKKFYYLRQVRGKSR